MKFLGIVVRITVFVLLYSLKTVRRHRTCKMPPSACQSSLTNQLKNDRMLADFLLSLPQSLAPKENQRPPVYNPEDYIQSLKKFERIQNSVGNTIYDTNETNTVLNNGIYHSSTLPTNFNNYKSSLSVDEGEMSLRQFSSISDLLGKLKADIRASFQSFIQELISPPLDGITLLLEVLRAIQLSQTSYSFGSANNATVNKYQTFHKRALLDELACLQCLAICCSRSPEACARLRSTSVGLLPLAASATGQGIRSRALALQLLTITCDRTLLFNSNQKNSNEGHLAVSEALSTLRLRCGEPVRFRLLIGILNSGGGSGELQVFGIRFINTFLESAENLQNRLYIQAELFQAGFDPNNMAKTISSTSPWLEKLRYEIKRYSEITIDVEKLQLQAGDGKRLSSQMVILERRIEILQEEKSVLTLMERRLQERCAELQREVFRLQGILNTHFKNPEQKSIALQRHVLIDSKQSSDHEDEGISSSDTGPSLSPPPILVLPEAKHRSVNCDLRTMEQTKLNNDDISITAVINELETIVKNAEREMIKNEADNNHNLQSCKKHFKENDIVPVHILPQPPRKTRSLIQLIPQDGSDMETSEFGILLIPNNNSSSLFDDLEVEPEKNYELIEYPNNNRKILDEIMCTRDNDNDPTLNALRSSSFIETNSISVRTAQSQPQQFNGVFFMTNMNSTQRNVKSVDMVKALQAHYTSKKIENIQKNDSNSIINTSSSQNILSRSDQQIYFAGHFDSHPNLRNDGSRLNVAPNSYIFQDSSHKSLNMYAKVIDTPSGLY